MTLEPKIFVLDTSVILYDFNSVASFEEHDLAIPIAVLEELDRFKKGSQVINLNAREFLREVDRISERHDLGSWVAMNGHERGRLRVINDAEDHPEVARAFGAKTADHRILGAALRLAAEDPQRRVVLVTKDINLRVKARSLGLTAEDYENVRIREVDQLYTGRSELAVDAELIDRLFQTEGLARDELPADLFEGEEPVANQYFILRAPGASALAWYNPGSKRLEVVPQRTAYGVTPRNAEQTFALHAVLNRDVPLVTISGAAGTGKTLITLAGALELRRDYRQIFLARPIVPLSNKDIGYLPGDINSKIGPFMQPLWDSLGVIKGQLADREKDAKRIDEMIELGKLDIVPLAYIRGRSFASSVFIVDEAQNLTPHEVKTVITRAGEGTKIVLTGDIFQIDTPYLDAHSNGLSYLIDRLRGQGLYAHVNLERGERSALANLASELL